MIPEKKARLSSDLFFLIGGDHLTLEEHSLTTIRLFAGKRIRDKIEVDQETLARLRLVEGLTNAQLAQRFGISLTSVKLKLYDLDRTGNRANPKD